jgi:hypothetical protein
MKITLQGGKALTARLQHIGPAVRVNAWRELGFIGEHLATDGRAHFEDNGLHTRTGDFRRSFAAMPVTQGGSWIRGGMLAGQGLPYPPVHEFGATITPKNSQYLAIPLEEALTAAGVAKFAPRDAEAAGYKTFFRGKILYGVKDGILYPLFVMVTSVTIPARPTVGPTLDRNKDWIVERLKKATDEAVVGAH